jgi:serine/threonine-protein kinase
MASEPSWVGREVAHGRYRVQERIGLGSMGHVYRALDRHLETEVVIKCPFAEGMEQLGPAFLRRFELEVRSLVHLSHPHVVQIIDVGAEDGHPYVVMQYLSGGSLRDRMESGPRQTPRPMPLTTLGDWLMDVAKALDFIHGQNYLHRDVKPDNILFDRFGNPFLSDFGIIKALASERHDVRTSAMTAPGFLMGTPNYVAPEIVMGGPVDGRCDQYALGMTVFEVLAGSNPMQGPTPSATFVNQTKKSMPALIDLIPNAPRRLSDAVARALAKRPEERFERCAMMATEILAELPRGTASRTVSRSFLGMESRGTPGRVACPVCGNPMAVGPGLAGKGVRCKRCEATLRVEMSEPGTIVLNVVGQPSASWSAATEATPPGSKPQSPPAARVRMRRRVAAGVLGLCALAGALLVGRALIGTDPPRPEPAAGPPTPTGADATAAAPAIPGDRVVVNIAYGTEKKKWLVAALEEYAQTAAGREVEIKLLGMGSLEGAQAVLGGPRAGGPAQPPIHVWSPASGTYRDVLESTWRSKHGSSPILSSANLALTPMVFVMWKQRHEAFLKKYGAINFQTLAAAMREPGGWQAIAQRGDWGLFKFSHTDPGLSNSGLQMLVLMGHEFVRKARGLTPQEVARGDFQSWLRNFEHGVTRYGTRLNHSTGDLMEEMVIRGPSQYDCLLLYENLAIDYMQPAIGRWGTEGGLAVSYPEPNIWNEHPYYILDVPWSDARQRKAAAEFLIFLMSEPIQRRALEHGFRPGNPAVPVNSSDSPLVRNEGAGVRLQLPGTCGPQSAEVVRSLLEAFRRIER